MHVSSVNLAVAPAKLKVGSRLTSTGIYKRPTDEPVAIGPLGLSSDTIWSKKHHGGPDQAVYVYGEEDYAWWAAELGRPLEPGTFGENLTVAGLESGAALVGDRLRVGDEVVLEVTCGRIPCGTLTARMGIRAFAQRFRKAGRPGLYCRVTRAGRRCGPAMPCATSRRPGARSACSSSARCSTPRRSRASSSSVLWLRPSASAAGACTRISWRRCARPERAPPRASAAA